MSFNRYPEYKESNIPQLGDIPSHWRIERFDVNTSSHRKTITPNLLANKTIFHYSIPAIQDYGTGIIEEGSNIDSNKIIIDEPQLLISKLNPRKQTIILAAPHKDYLTVASSEFVPLLSKNIDIKYAKYVWLSKYCYEYLMSRCESATKSHQRVSPTDITKMFWGFPTTSEQEMISNFLDNEIAKIDCLVVEQEKLIRLLTEKRRSLISNAVTKGIDQTIKLKDSGVEWLGDVPAHWKVLKIKRLSTVQRGASPRPIDDPKYFDETGEYGWVRISDVSSSNGVLKETEQKLSDLGSSLSVKIEPKQLFISIAGTVGKPCISAIKACIHDGFVYFPNLKINPWWLFRIFEAGVCYGGLGKLGTQLNLNTDTVGSISIGVPPDQEIESILSLIESKLKKFDGLIFEAQKVIDFSLERRSSLISAAVTGQIDVRNYQPKEVA
jgi:type I restriction enzyme S subunit